MPEEVEDIFAEESEVITPAKPVTKTSTKPPAKPEPTVEVEAVATEPKSKKPFPWKIILIILAIVVIVGGLGAGGFFYYQNIYNANKNEPNINVEASVIDITQVGENGKKETVITKVKIDTDFDGLSDEEEAEYNTSIKKADTDGDGLTDREEVRVYLTDPLKEDSDNDNYSDGEEVSNGFNPMGKGQLLDLEEEILRLEE